MSLLDLCQRIQQLAIECETHHVHVSYAAHTKGLGVRVINIDADYMECDYMPIIDRTVYLDWDRAINELQGIVDYLEELK